MVKVGGLYMDSPTSTISIKKLVAGVIRYKFLDVLVR